MNVFAVLLLSLIQTDIPGLIAQTGVVAKIVLVILLCFSIFSWAIIYSKWKQFKILQVQSEQFVRAFRRTRKVSDMNVLVDNFPSQPLKVIFEAGYKEVVNQVGNPGGPVTNSTALGRTLQIASSQQLSELEENLNWLATAGAVTPFIGLFGTVWGIMNAFLGMGAAGAVSLRVIGPGIAEALVATAAGLFVAVPAVIGYNHFLSKIKEMGIRLDNFSLEFLNAAERNQP